MCQTFLAAECRSHKGKIRIYLMEIVLGLRNSQVGLFGIKKPFRVTEGFFKSGNQFVDYPGVLFFLELIELGFFFGDLHFLFNNFLLFVLGS